MLKEYTVTSFNDFYQANFGDFLSLPFRGHRIRITQHHRKGFPPSGKNNNIDNWRNVGYEGNSEQSGFACVEFSEVCKGIYSRSATYCIIVAFLYGADRWERASLVHLGGGDYTAFNWSKMTESMPVAKSTYCVALFNKYALEQRRLAEGMREHLNRLFSGTNILIYQAPVAGANSLAVNSYGEWGELLD